MFQGLNLYTQDYDVSGFKPIYTRLNGNKLSNLQGIKNIVATRPDRLFRNTSDALLTVDDWDKKNIILHLADAGGVSLSTQSAIGKLIFTTIISFAQFERDICSDRTRAVLNNKKASGKVFCGSIYGYDKVKGELVKNKAEQTTIKEIFTLSKKGNNDSQIATAINGRGIRTKKGKYFQASTIQTILNNPIHQTL